jgi:adenylate cyclase
MGALEFLYRKLGSSYPFAFLMLELQSAFVITAGTIFLFSFYYDAPDDDFLLVGAIAMVLTALAVAATLVRLFPKMRPLSRWIAGKRSPEDTEDAWRAAIDLPLRMIRSDVWVPIVGVVLPTVIVSLFVFDAPWYSFFPLFAAAMVALGYSATLHYLVLEAGLRPVLLDINRELPPQLRTGHQAVSLRVRLLATIPMINIITGFLVAALTSEDSGTANLGADVLIALGVASTIALELTLLLTKSILRPVADLHRATHLVAEGRYNEVQVPVTTGDELGELAASFNDMVDGLREREQIREAFGTYLDRDVAEYILSEGFSEEGVDIEVSILFCDVRDFTEFSADASPQEVVAALNRLFEVIVPVIANEGGHVDKFEGDGLMAVFGAPEPFADHADRAVRAACAIARRVNHDGEAGDLRVGVGVNSGRVVAGSIGGGGRLDFSVIGNAVNLAARVQEATRDTGDDLLITTDTWKLLSHEFEAESRGHVELKGVPEPVALHAPAIVAAEEPEEVAAAEDEEAAATPAGATFTTLRSRLRDRLGR